MEYQIIPTPARSNISENQTEFRFSAVSVKGPAGEGIRHACKLFDPQLKMEEGGNLILYHGADVFPEEIRGKTFSWFADRNAGEQGYFLSFEGKAVIAASYSETGCMYALMTLKQLYIDGKLPESFEIEDKPSFLYRANKWLQWTEAGIWSYDRGDGIEAFKERIIRKLDMSLRFKINSVVFDGFGFRSERFPGYNQLMKELNREARKRKIHLMSSGYAMGYGMIGHGKGIFQGEAHKNRKSYPDGEVYNCIGTYDLGNPEDMVVGREYGTCISNQGLMDEKLRELTEYMRATEPGALYLHNMDADYILEPLWAARCPECKKRWPSDCLWEEDGAAGAFAYFINTLYEGICSVKTEDYDASRDCVVYIVSPGYIYMHASDGNFEKARKFWQKVSSLLKHSDRLFIGFRENYFQHDGGQRRFSLMREGWKNCGIAGVGFFGGDGFYSDKLFLGAGLFLGLMKEADVMIIENGNANQEPMQVYNAEYLWNCENSAFYRLGEIPQKYEEFFGVYREYLSTRIRPEEIYGKGGLLEVICEKLYGKDAASDFADLYRLHGGNYEPPLISACSCEIYTNFSKVVYPMRWDNAELELEGALSVNSVLEKFSGTDKVTCEAAELSEKIFREKKYLPELEKDVKWLSENFRINSIFTGMLKEYMVCYKQVLTHFLQGDKVEEEVKHILEELRMRARQFMAELEALSLKAIDVLGGALVRRTELCDFIDYNCEIMLRSIEENSRIPSGLRPLPKRESW